MYLRSYVYLSGDTPGLGTLTSNVFGPVFRVGKRKKDFKTFLFLLHRSSGQASCIYFDELYLEGFDADEEIRLGMVHS